MATLSAAGPPERPRRRAGRGATAHAAVASPASPREPRGDVAVRAASAPAPSTAWPVRWAPRCTSGRGPPPELLRHADVVVQPSAACRRRPRRLSRATRPSVHGCCWTSRTTRGPPAGRRVAAARRGAIAHRYQLLIFQAVDQLRWFVGGGPTRSCPGSMRDRGHVPRGQAARARGAGTGAPRAGASSARVNGHVSCAGVPTSRRTGQRRSRTSGST
ncbi:hypothetical protein QJS66_04010 [Kocuria rhizophila]|nr:hypothetical protein QJS66_04010 [Kocuria rhizophila]